MKRIMSNLKYYCRIVGRVKARKNFRNQSRGSPLRGDSLPKSGNFWYFGAAFPPREPNHVKDRVVKRTHVPLGRAKFHVNRCGSKNSWHILGWAWPQSYLQLFWELNKRDCNFCLSTTILESRSHGTLPTHGTHNTESTRWRPRCKIYQTFTIFHFFRTVI